MIRCLCFCYLCCFYCFCLGVCCFCSSVCCFCSGVCCFCLVVCCFYSVVYYVFQIVFFQHFCIEVDVEAEETSNLKDSFVYEGLHSFSLQVECNSFYCACGEEIGIDYENQMRVTSDV